MTVTLIGSAIRQMKRIQERETYEGSLIEFAEYVWPVVEPAIPFVRGWVIEAIAEHLEAVTRGDIKRLLINVPPGFTKSLMTDVFWPAWIWGPQNRPWYRFMCAAYSNHLTERDNMRCRNVVISDRYQRLWGSRFGISNEQFTKVKFANTKTGWKLATSVGGIGTGERADIVIIDDPNNPLEMEFEATRNHTNMWFTEIIPDRLNNPRESAIVVIQQRTHEEDVSGTAISREMGYTHLMIPMRYDPGRHCATAINWEDPRNEDEELAWPERFPVEVCDGLQRDKGPYAWCNPGDAPVLMADDLGLKPISQVQKGDRVLGFVTGDKGRRARLQPAEVLSISVSRRQTVKITLDSGEVIRCTPDHKWWTGRQDKTHPAYAPAYAPGAALRGKRDKGSVLSRVCPSSLPSVSTPEDTRLAGWLAGFFDGEGTVSVNKRREGERSPLLGFSQGNGRNGPLCLKLEAALDHFGFNWSKWEKNKPEGHAVNFYWLKMAKEGRASRIGLYQKFLHIVQPVKWRDRIVDLATHGRLYTSGERVVSIEPYGEEIVYGLETTTGNYVVWGLASSNSGQYQQIPEPRGGSIIKRDYWQLWKDPKFPNMELILASLDTAYTAKEENDASALTIWGLFRDPMRNPKIMLMYAWQARLEFHDLIEKVIATCLVTPAPATHARFPVDKLIIENKASGQSVGQELYRMFRGTGRLGIELINPTMYGDKVARVHAVEHLFADQMIFAPDKSWADTVIDQCAIFPRGAHDDLVDSTSQALRYLRDCGFALKRDEHSIVEQEEMKYISPSATAPLYPF